MKKNLIKYLSVFLILVCTICVLPQKTAYADEPITPSSEVSTFSLMDPNDGVGGGSWYAPKGGTWTWVSTTNTSTIYCPTTITYVPYDALVLIQSKALCDGTLQGCQGIIADKGISLAKDYVKKYIQNKKGAAVLEKIAPYLGNMILFYNFCEAAKSFATAKRIDVALKNKTGLAFSTGADKYGNWCDSIDTWTGNMVYNPSGLIGEFSANK